MYCQPRADPSSGRVEATANGGMRRIDRLLHDVRLPSRPAGAAFVTAIAGQTDHVPFALTLATK